MKIFKIMCAIFGILMAILGETASGLPPMGRDGYNRVKRDDNVNNFDRAVGLLVMTNKKK